ncbi:MAG: RES domain-containing protein [Thermoanaerobaculales bacterium]
MVKFPEPPSVPELRALGIGPAEEHTLVAGSRVWRIYFQTGQRPGLWNGFRGFGPTDARFDHHPPPAAIHTRKILYGAGQGRVCVAEVFQGTRTIDRRRRNPWLVAFEIVRDLRLLDLRGLWPTRVGASQAISSGSRRRAQRWSRRIYEAFPGIQGLCYPSSMGGGAPAFALYERAADAIPATQSFHRALADPALHIPLENAAHQIGYAIV